MAVLNCASMAKEKTLQNKKKTLLIAQELKLARVLAGNNKVARDRALKGLRKWFESRSINMPFTDKDFLRLWKGLFYTMWMSDKPLVQEECAENIAALMHSLTPEGGLNFYKCGSQILINEWFGIDQLRLDKFLMFVRRLLRQALFVLKHEKWSKEIIAQFSDVLSATFLSTVENSNISMGLLIHFTEIYLEELAKVGEGAIPPESVTFLLAPFMQKLAFSDDRRLIDHIRKHVFVYLMRQSDLGLEYQAKYDAWKELGFPGTINAMQKIENAPQDKEEEVQTDGNVEESTKIYDPRAGRVDVELPQIKFRAKMISKALAQYKFNPHTNTNSRRCLNELSEQFKKMASGVYPLGVNKVKLAPKDTYDTKIRKAVNRLVKFDRKIKGENSRKRKRKLAESVSADDSAVELRSGKKVKLDKELRQKLRADLQMLTENTLKKRHKVKIAKPETPPENVESIFERNSGTWFVTRTTTGEENAEDVEAPILKPVVKSHKPENVFPKREWESADENEETEKLICEIRKKTSTDRRKSAPAFIVNQEVQNSVKKVKINVKLNRSQDLHEHEARIMSSPAIPFDANKKPAKPLLKTPIKRSPINPFYKLKSH